MKTLHLMISGRVQGVDRLLAACHRGTERARVSAIEAAQAAAPPASGFARAVDA